MCRRDSWGQKRVSFPTSRRVLHSNYASWHCQDSMWVKQSYYQTLWSRKVTHVLLKHCWNECSTISVHLLVLYQAQQRTVSCSPVSSIRFVLIQYMCLYTVWLLCTLMCSQMQHIGLPYTCTEHGAHAILDGIIWTHNRSIYMTQLCS
jgi:hypothetical protein